MSSTFRASLPVLLILAACGQQASTSDNEVASGSGSHGGPAVLDTGIDLSHIKGRGAPGAGLPCSARRRGHPACWPGHNPAARST